MSDQTYTRIQDDNGQDYLCPVATEEQRDDGHPEERDDCFEKNVTERYSGNFTVD